MNYNVTLKSVPSYNVISLKGTIPSYSEEGILWKKLIEYIQKKKITMNLMLIRLLIIFITISVMTLK